MRDKKETVTIQIPEPFTFGDLSSDDFDKVLSFFDWSLKDKRVEFDNSRSLVKKNDLLTLYFLYSEYLFSNNCIVAVKHPSEIKEGLPIPRVTNAEYFEKLFDSKEELLWLLEKYFVTIVICSSDDREKALKFTEKFTRTLDVEYEKTLRYVINELLYNTLEHGRNRHDVPSFLQFFLDEKSNELSFIVADVGVGIKKHLRQTYPTLATDVEAILHAIKPQVSGTFGKSQTDYETINNAGVGLYFSSSLVQKLKADMVIVSGNGFVHISPTEIISKELENKWKGTFVYIKMKREFSEDSNFQKMMSEITEAIPKADKSKQSDVLYISIRNYFGKYAEDKDLAKKIRDEQLLPALAENKTLTIDFEDIISAPHSLLNAMLATPIRQLGLVAYKKIKVINVSSDIRVTLDFIFDDNTSND